MLNKIFSQPIQNHIFLLTFILIGWVFLTFRLLEVPPGINGDEAVIGLNAALVSRTGYDINGRFLPLFTAYKDSYDWKQPITFYAEVLAFRLFGPSYFTLRAVSVIFALLGGILIFFLIKELLGKREAIFGTIIFTLTPIIIIQSHLALENIAPIPFITLWLLMLIKYYKRQLTKYLVISAISLGVSFYSYLGLRLIVPVLAALSLIYIYLANKSPNFKGVVSRLLFFLLCLLPFLMLLLLVRKSYPGAILARSQPPNLSSYWDLMLPYISSFDLSFLFILGDTTPYHSTGKHGMFLIATLPLLAIGIFKIAHKNNFVLNFILLTFFLSPILYGVTPSIHRGSRLLFFVPFCIIFICFGFNFLLAIKNKILWLLLISGMFVLIALNAFDFVYYYWYKYPTLVKSEFAKPYHLVFERAYQLSKEKKSTVFIQNNFRTDNLVAVDYFEQMYFPDKLKFWNEDESPPKKSIIITTDPSLSIKKDIGVEKFGENGFGLIIN